MKLHSQKRAIRERQKCFWLLLTTHVTEKKKSNYNGGSYAKQVLSQSFSVVLVAVVH